MPLFDLDDLIFRLKRYCVNYFDLTTKATRKEFNLAILVYSVALLIILWIITDWHAINDVLYSQVAPLQVDVMEGSVKEQEAANQALTLMTDLIPITFMNVFPLLLLPLYIRRLNDTIFHTIGFAFPIVTVYVFDAIHSIFAFKWVFGLYGIMSIYTFIMIAVLCAYPSKQEDTEEDKV